MLQTSGLTLEFLYGQMVDPGKSRTPRPKRARGTIYTCFLSQVQCGRNGTAEPQGLTGWSVPLQTHILSSQNPITGKRGSSNDMRFPTCSL